MLAGAIVGGCSAPPGEDGGEARFAVAANVCAPSGDAGSGTTWSDLHRDYFGPTGKASCAGTGQCHGDGAQPGAQASGYVCGPTAAACYAGITSQSANLLTVGDTTDDPTTTLLYATLRKCSGGGTMPLSPANLQFTSADMARIAAWIKSGAPDN